LPLPCRRQPEALVERLDAVGELELVALGAAEELHPGGTVGGRRGQRVERGDLARRPAREGRVERQLVEVHAVAESEEVVAGHRAAGYAQQRDPRHARRSERAQRRAVEGPAGRGREAGRLRPILPARGVQAEGLLQRGRQRVRLAGDLERDIAEPLELAAPPSVEAAALGRRPLPVHRVPAAGEVEHRRIGAPDQLQPLLPGRRGEAAALREAEHVDEVGALGRGALDEGACRIGARIAGDEHIGERCGVLADHVRDAQPEPALDEQRKGAGQPSGLAGRDDAQPPIAAAVSPPLEQPAVQQERARPRHRVHEPVPLGCEVGEGVRVGDRRQRGHRASDR